MKVKKGCKIIVCLSTSSTLSINDKIPQGFKKTFTDNGINNNAADIISCYSYMERNNKIVKKICLIKKKPDGIIALVEKLTTLMPARIYKFLFRIK